MTIVETITTQFNKAKALYTQFVPKFPKYQDFLKIKDNTATVRYTYVVVDGVEYIDVVEFHMEDVEGERENPETGETETVVVGQEEIIDREYRITSFRPITITYCKTKITECKDAVSALDILGEDLTIKQKNFLVVAIAFETAIVKIEEILTPAEESNLFTVLTAMVNGVSL